MAESKDEPTMRSIPFALAALLCSGLTVASAQTGSKNPLTGGVVGKAPVTSPTTTSPSSPGGMMLLSTDTCNTPTPINGAGNHPFDTTTATTSGFNGGGTCAAGASTIGKDLFWQWTATAAGDWEFDTFGSGFDTKLSVHAGVGCAATCVAYNDDTSGLQSRVSITNVNIGDTFLVQVGGFSTASGVGVLNINPYVDPCSLLPVDAFEPNDDCPQSAVIGDGTYPGLTVSKTNWDYYEVNVADGDTLTVDLFFTHSTADVDIFLYDVPGCQPYSAGNVGTTGSLVYGYTASDNESISWTNTTGSTQTYKIKINVWASSTGNCNTYDMVVGGTTGGVHVSYCNGDGSGTLCPCGNQNDGSNGVAGCANSAGAGGGKLVATGSNSIAAGDLVLAGSTLQTGQAGLYLQGNNATGGGNGTVFGDGLRCAGGGVVRLQIRNSGMTGSSFTTVNIGSIGGVAPGDVKRYQLWFRDTAGPCGSGFNFTNGIEVTWAP